MPSMSAGRPADVGFARPGVKGAVHLGVHLEAPALAGSSGILIRRHMDLPHHVLTSFASSRPVCRAAGHPPQARIHHRGNLGTTPLCSVRPGRPLQPLDLTAQQNLNW